MAPCGKSGVQANVSLTVVNKQIGDSAESRRRTPWANFKRVIWHKSMYKLLESIKIHSKVGCWVDCGDGMVRHIFPLILVLAADYEEQ